MKFTLPNLHTKSPMMSESFNLKQKICKNKTWW